MIKHVVCFKLKNNSEQECKKAADLLRTMKNKVPIIEDIFVGVDLLHSDRSYDIILEVTLKDMATLDAYQNDEYHCNVIKTYMHSVRESSIALDVEL